MRTLARTPFDHDTFAVAAGTRRLVAPLVAVAAVAGALASASAYAQSGVPCTAIVNDAERLACYDRALRGAPPAAPTAPASTAARTKASHNSSL